MIINFQWITILMVLALSVSSPLFAKQVSLEEMMKAQCPQEKTVQETLMREAESGHFTFRRVEFIGNLRIRHKELRRRLLFNEGDEFTQAVLEKSLDSVSGVTPVAKLDLSVVVIFTDSKYKTIDLAIFIRARTRQRTTAERCPRRTPVEPARAGGRFAGGSGRGARPVNLMLGAFF